MGHRLHCGPLRAMGFNANLIDFTGFGVPLTGFIVYHPGSMDSLQSWGLILKWSNDLM